MASIEEGNSNDVSQIINSHESAPSSPLSQSQEMSLDSPPVVLNGVDNQEVVPAESAPSSPLRQSPEMSLDSPHHVVPNGEDNQEVVRAPSSPLSQSHEMSLDSPPLVVPNGEDNQEVVRDEFAPSSLLSQSPVVPPNEDTRSISAGGGDGSSYISIYQLKPFSYAALFPRLAGPTYGYFNNNHHRHLEVQSHSRQVSLLAPGQGSRRSDSEKMVMKGVGNGGVLPYSCFSQGESSRSQCLDLNHVRDPIDLDLRLSPTPCEARNPINLELSLACPINLGFNLFATREQGWQWPSDAGCKRKAGESIELDLSRMVRRQRLLLSSLKLRAWASERTRGAGNHPDLELSLSPPGGQGLARDARSDVDLELRLSAPRQDSRPSHVGSSSLVRMKGKTPLSVYDCFPVTTTVGNWDITTWQDVAGPSNPQPSNEVRRTESDDDDQGKARLEPAPSDSAQPEPEN